MANYKHKRSSQVGKVPLPADIGVGEIAINLTDKKLFSKNEVGQVFSFDLGSGGGSGGGGTPVTSPFIGLPDTPATYVGTAGKFLKVNAAANGLEFTDPPTGGGGVGGGNISVYQHGLLKLTTGTSPWYPPQSITLNKLQAYVEKPPTGADIIARIKRNGIPVQSITIVSGNYKAADIDMNLSITASDRITMDVTQVGAIFAGEDLTLRLLY